MQSQIVYIFIKSKIFKYFQIFSKKAITQMGCKWLLNYWLIDRNQSCGKKTSPVLLFESIQSVRKKVASIISFVCKEKAKKTNIIDLELKNYFNIF